MSLNGIDIASWQAELVPSNMKTTNFIIVKATGGTAYTNPCFHTHMQQAINSGHQVGCYCFAQERGCKGTAKQEAEYFVNAVRHYIGKAILALDWEEDALWKPVSWAKEWLDYVYSKTGVKPVIYMSKSTCNDRDWSSVADAGYELWVAQYPNYNEVGYLKEHEIWTDSAPFGAWGTWRIFQYTSVGRVRGFAGRLDLDLFRGDVTDWLAMAAGKTSAKIRAKIMPKKSTVKRAQRYYKRLKVYNGVIDGVCGKYTEKARIKAMQKALNTMGAKLVVDGVCGNLTKAAFKKYQKKIKTSAAMAKAIQAALLTWGYDCGKIDGVYGKYTEQAVKGFQKAHDLAADCIVGPQTFNVLFG